MPSRGDAWPARLPVRQVRVARPTDRLEEVVAFYRDGLGLAELDRFQGHDGYSGIMLGLPQRMSRAAPARRRARRTC